MMEILHKPINDDISAAIEDTPQTYKFEDIDGIVAEICGENDELNWYWILKLLNGSYVYAVGWCDYSGWG